MKYTKVPVPGCIDEVHTIVLARSGEEMYAVRGRGGCGRRCSRIREVDAPADPVLAAGLSR